MTKGDDLRIEIAKSFTGAAEPSKLPQMMNRSKIIAVCV